MSSKNQKNSSNGTKKQKTPQQMKIYKKFGDDKNQQFNLINIAQQRNLQQSELSIIVLNQRLIKLDKVKESLQIQMGKLKYKNQRLEKQFEEYKLQKERQIQQFEKNLSLSIIKYQNSVNDYQTAINQRMDYLQKNQYLQDQLEYIKTQKKNIIADKDKQKLQFIDLLKKQMNQKINQMRINLLTMKKQYMSTNQRLIFLQNHKLTQQIQFQWKNTENMRKRNDYLENKLKQLNQEFQLQKQISNQLAKKLIISKKIQQQRAKQQSIKINSNTTSIRSGILKKPQRFMNSQHEKIGSNVSLDFQGENKQNSIMKTNHKIEFTYNKQYSNQNINLNINANRRNKIQNKKNIKQNIQQEKQLIKIIKQLKKQLQNYQNELQNLKTEKQNYQKLYKQFKPKYEYYLKTQNDLRILMIKFLTQALDGKITGEKNGKQYNINKLKQIDVQDWTLTDIQITINMLLTFLRPHFTMKNMKGQYLKYKGSILSQKFNNSIYNQNLQLKQLNQISNNLQEKNKQNNCQITNYNDISLLSDNKRLRNQYSQLLRKTKEKGKSLSIRKIVQLEKERAIKYGCRSIKKDQKKQQAEKPIQFNLLKICKKFYKNQPKQSQQKLKKSQSQCDASILEDQNMKKEAKLLKNMRNSSQVPEIINNNQFVRPIHRQVLPYHQGGDAYLNTTQTSNFSLNAIKIQSTDGNRCVNSLELSKSFNYNNSGNQISKKINKQKQNKVFLSKTIKNKQNSITSYDTLFNNSPKFKIFQLQKIKELGNNQSINNSINLKKLLKTRIREWGNKVSQSFANKK